MDPSARECVTRCRLLVLREIVRAGGRPLPGQVARALELEPRLEVASAIVGFQHDGAVVKEDGCGRRPLPAGTTVEEK